MKKGKLIVMEGACDGIGKSTQYKLLRDRLVGENNRVITHHFPSYGTMQGQLVEEYLKGTFGSPRSTSPYFVNSLYAIDRKITWDSELVREYEQGSIVLLDRYTTSSLIYQSALMDGEERKAFAHYVCNYEYEKLGIPEPDQVIFLQAPFEVVTRMREQRRENDGISNDIYERDLDLMKKIYDNAVFLADYLGWDIIECSTNNEMSSIDDIHEKVYQLVK